MKSNSLPSASVSKAEANRSAKNIYIWLLLSALITVPWMVINLFNTHPGYNDTAPAWSPDGRSIAFISDRSGRRHLYVMDANGKNQRGPLGQDEKKSADHPVWSPDGSLIAFTCDQLDSLASPAICTIQPDGSNEKKLTPILSPSYIEFSWSPDGRHIAFARPNSIYVRDADGTNEVKLTNIEGCQSFYSPAWSPDGRFIAYLVEPCSTGAKLYVMNSDGKDPRQVTVDPSIDLRVSNLAWSPDSKFIAFASGAFPQTQIYVMNADGTNAHSITVKDFVKSDPAWSPDGSQIAFVSADGPVLGDSIISILPPKASEIYVMNEDGTDVRNLTNSRTPVSEYVLAVIPPALVHIILLLGLLSPALFVRRHAQQAIALVMLRLLSTILLIGITRGENWQVWILVNGSLWLIGSAWGMRQIKRGDCWLMRVLGEVKGGETASAR